MAEALSTAGTGVPYGLLLSRLGQDATARFRRALRPLGLSAQQFIVLKQLEAIGSTSQTALADALGIDYSNLATVAGELCDKKLIVRAREECDRRRYALDLTDEGHALLADADRAIASGETTCSRPSTRASAPSCGNCCGAWRTRSSCARAPRPKRARRPPGFSRSRRRR